MKLLIKMKSLRESHLHLSPSSDERVVPLPVDTQSSKRLVLILYHDESIFNTNEFQTWACTTAHYPAEDKRSRDNDLRLHRTT